MGNFFGTVIRSGADIYSAFGNTSKIAYVDSRDVGAVAAEMLSRPNDFKVISKNFPKIKENIKKNIKYKY